MKRRDKLTKVSVGELMSFVTAWDELGFSQKKLVHKIINDGMEARVRQDKEQDKLESILAILGGHNFELDDILNSH